VEREGDSTAVPNSAVPAAAAVDEAGKHDRPADPREAFYQRAIVGRGGY